MREAPPFPHLLPLTPLSFLCVFFVSLSVVVPMSCPCPTAFDNLGNLHLHANPHLQLPHLQVAPPGAQLHLHSCQL